MKNQFLIKPYIGSDGDDFRKDFYEYLDSILATGRWEAMNDHSLFLQGAKQAITEISAEIKSSIIYEATK